MEEDSQMREGGGNIKKKLMTCLCIVESVTQLPGAT